MAIIAQIISTFDPKGINNARKSFSALTDENVSGAKKQQIAMKLLGGAFAATGVAAAAFATKLAVSGVRAALEDEKSLVALNKTLSNLGLGFKSNAVDDFINKLQFTTGVADDQLRPALSRLLLATGSLTKSQDMLNLALDISVGTGRDLDSVTTALSKAALGQFTALQRLGVGLDEATLKTKDLDLITKTLSAKFSGQALTAADTYAGRLRILQLGADEASEALGYGLLDAADVVTKALGYDTGGFAQALADAGEELGNFTRETGYTTAGIITLLQELRGSADETGLFSRYIQNIGDQLLKQNPKLELFVRLLQLANLVGEQSVDTPLPYTTMHQQRILRQRQKEQEERANAIAAAEEKRKEAEREAEKAAQEAIRKHEQALKDLEQQQQRVNKTSEDFAKFVAGTSPTTMQGSLDIAKSTLDKMKNELSGTNKLTEKSADKFQELSSIIQNNFSNALDTAQNNLDQAKQAFQEFRDAISGSITGTLNFASAIEESDFLSGLQKQADTAIKFSERISKLLEMGLSEPALRQVLNAGAETGTAIADQIIAGGSTVVQKVNTLIKSVEDVATQVGDYGAKQFYSAGVAQGEALVEGIRQSIISSAAEIASLAAQLSSTTITVQPPSVTPTGDGAETKKQDEKKTPPKPLTKTEKIVKAAGGAQSTAASRSYTAMAAAMGLIRLAEGGIVERPTVALIGEAGPEAVVPLNKSNQMGTTINIVVNAGIGTSGAQVGREIVDAIKKYERTSGPVFVSA